MFGPQTTVKYTLRLFTLLELFKKSHLVKQCLRFWCSGNRAYNRASMTEKTPMLSFTITACYRLSSSMKSYSGKLTSDLNSRWCFLFSWVGAKAIHDSRLHGLCWAWGTFCSKTIWGPFIILTTIAKHTVTSKRSPVSFSNRSQFD